MSTALFIGRFQPFHQGHLSVVKEIIGKHNQILLGIGSAEDSFLPENPFTAGERYAMIRAALQEAKLDLSKIAIIPIRNINNYALWVKHIALYLPPFEVVYTGSPIVRQLFEANGGYEIREVKKKLKISSTAVREKMLKDEKWEELVTPAVAAQIKKIKGVERMRNILEKT